MPRTTAISQEERAQAQDRPDMVYRELRELIVSGRLAPGTRLVETIAARRLGVSRTPVRSAFHRLQREGYAVAANEGDERQRLVVAPITADDAADQTLMRERFGVYGPPAILFFNESGDELRGHRVVGFKPAAQFADHLRRVAQ